jgi:hypothetical protein
MLCAGGPVKQIMAIIYFVCVCGPVQRLDAD